ncbi:MAG: hypothetical protein EOP33_00250 [Rickettsiaceae bacterium]|nr:MAG: hypothetical protein EOP33_00250 [Rickettsiaceae bacterium]
MKKIISTIFILTFFNSLSCLSLYAQTQNYAHSFSFPVDVTKEQGMRTQLILNIPKEFRCLQEDQILSSPNYHGILEFIPQNDDEYKWSKIITSNSYAGKSIKAQDLIAFMKNNFLQNATDVKIIEENVSQFNAIESAIISMIYTYKGRRELIRVKAFSGSFDCASVQYAIVLAKDKTENQELETLKLWMDSDSNIKLINF